MLIVGLGNPEDKYRNTRHNAGMMLVDLLAKKNNLEWKKRKDLLCFLAKKGDLVLAKPLTFMNESGKAVAKLMGKLKVNLNDLYLAHDELDIRLGEYKITLAKSSPLHKGISSVEEYLKTKDFYRIRIGVDNRKKDNRIIGERYVLQDFLKEERDVLEGVFEKIILPGFQAFL